MYNEFTRDGQRADRISPYDNLDPNSPLIRIAFIEFLESWGYEEDMYEWIRENKPRVESYWKKWQEWLTSLKEPHCGDCTGVAMGCTRCWTEQFLDNAKFILELK